MPYALCPMPDSTSSFARKAIKQQTITQKGDSNALRYSW